MPKFDWSGLADTRREMDARLAEFFAKLARGQNAKQDLANERRAETVMDNYNTEQRDIHATMYECWQNGLSLDDAREATARKFPPLKASTIRNRTPNIYKRFNRGELPEDIPLRKI